MQVLECSLRAGTCCLDIGRPHVPCKSDCHPQKFTDTPVEHAFCFVLERRVLGYTLCTVCIMVVPVLTLDLKRDNTVTYNMTR